MPINYWDGDVPEFKAFQFQEVMNNNMNDAFTSINEMKESILWGGEVQFQDQTGEIFGITRLSDEDIVLAHGDGTNELHFKHINDLLHYQLNGMALKQLLLETEIISRNY